MLSLFAMELLTNEESVVLAAAGNTSGLGIEEATPMVYPAASRSLFARGLRGRAVRRSRGPPTRTCQPPVAVGAPDDLVGEDYGYTYDPYSAKAN